MYGSPKNSIHSGWTCWCARSKKLLYIMLLFSSQDVACMFFHNHDLLERLGRAKKVQHTDATFKAIPRNILFLLKMYLRQFLSCGFTSLQFAHIISPRVLFLTIFLCMQDSSLICFCTVRPSRFSWRGWRGKTKIQVYNSLLPWAEKKIEVCFFLRLIKIGLLIFRNTVFFFNFRTNFLKAFGLHKLRTNRATYDTM